MGLSRRDFLRASAASLAAAGATVEAAAGPPRGAGEGGDVTGEPIDGGSASFLVPRPDHSKAADFDRLDPGWYRRALRRLQTDLRAQDLDGALLADRWNLVYYTGLFFTGTERPFCLFVPAEGDRFVWFHPALDRDLVESWWIREAETYFDFEHGKDGEPNQGKVFQGETVDLVEWIWRELKERRFGEKAIGHDTDLSDAARRGIAKAAPKATVRSVKELCLRHRRVKTPEEIALTQRAMNLSSRVHAFARDLVLRRGTDATDFEIAHEATAWATELAMKEIRRDGRPHTAVGLDFRVACRTGVATAYPHPNQFHHEHVRKGDALQIATLIRIGGYGGELYRAYQLAPWDSRRERVWDVHTEACRVQEQASLAGVTGSHVAWLVHQHQVKSGFAGLVYHRPAHGAGMEGHQAPYISLGDHTMLEEGMMFSNEPGLYDPRGGFGYNHSDTILVAKERGIRMSSVPLTREWCFLAL